MMEGKLDVSNGRLVVDAGWRAVVLILVFAVFSFYMYRRTLPRISKGRKITLALIRSMAFMLLVIFITNPVVKTGKREVIDPVVPIMVDVSTSMGIRDCKGKSRFEVATGLLKRFKAEGRRGVNVRLPLFSFSSHVSEIRHDSIPGPDNEGTDLIRSIKYVEKRFKYNNLEAIIVLSDGIETGESGPAVFSSPVYTVGIGDTASGGWLSIEDIVFQEEIYSGMSSRIEAVLTSRDLEAGERVDIIMSEDGEAIDSQTVFTGDGREEYRVSFDYLSNEEGKHRIRISVKEDQSVSGRKSGEFQVTVTREERKILYLDEHPDWNMTFLRRLDETMGRYQFDFVTWTEKRGYIGIPSYKEWRQKDFGSTLSDYSLLIISDGKILFSNPDNSADIADFVYGGGGALFLADVESPLVNSHQYDAIEKVIPGKRVSGVEFIQGNYIPSISYDSDDAISVLLSDAGDLKEVPPLSAMIKGIVPNMSTEVPLLLDQGSGSRYPLLMIERYGEGITGVVLGMPLWRWKLSGISGEKFYEGVFSSLIQFLSTGGELDILKVNLSRKTYSSGEEPRIYARIEENVSVKDIKGEVYEIAAEGMELVRSFIFDPVPGKDGLYGKFLHAPHPGYYRVLAKARSSSGKWIEGAAEFSVDSLSVELIERRMDRRFLLEIASNSGGSYYDCDVAGDLLSVIDPEERSVLKKGTFPVRSSVFFFLSIILLFATEWILRKVWGLV